MNSAEMLRPSSLAPAPHASVLLSACALVLEAALLGSTELVFSPDLRPLFFPAFEPFAAIPFSLSTSSPPPDLPLLRAAPKKSGEPLGPYALIGCATSSPGAVLPPNAMSRLISRRSNDDFPVLRSPHNITTGGGAPTDRAASTSRQTSSTPSSHAAGITAPNRTISPGGTAAGRSPSESGSGQAKAPSESARGGVRTIAARPADRPALVQLDCLSSARPASCAV
mmetsp:Transcript_49/g.214  ORF Transcript_49/g.214 Transcript_49/m.214 type:complete len:225 (+) Transcript_49:2016-2690(+)